APQPPGMPATTPLSAGQRGGVLRFLAPIARAVPEIGPPVLDRLGRQPAVYPLGDVRVQPEFVTVLGEDRARPRTPLRDQFGVKPVGRDVNRVHGLPPGRLTGIAGGDSLIHFGQPRVRGGERLLVEPP